jgi:hypothetical protein
MKSVSLSRQTSATTRPGSYRVDLTINSTNDITAFLFVKERVVKPDGTNDDTFVAVASPSQIEDINESSPGTGTVYFRDKTVSLISTDPQYLNDTVNEILADIQLTVLQMNELDVLTPPQYFTITADSIVVDSNN